MGHVTSTIRWEIVGDQIVEGRKAFAKALKAMEADEPMELTIHHMITHGKEASVNGEMKTAAGQVYAFCDVYKFSGFKNPKITEMTSYVLEI
ncbi:nuclear transport factor 2 family protein [Halalkalibaculum sp. DA3122]|uniref:nuclear transport factor 2 family protein n=1 Tax=unclassified Halalkalibaculum TaxID=2964617 RepID=UPI003754C758